MTRNDRASEKPIPSPDADSAQLWRGLRDGVLLLQHCDKCRHVQYYQQGMCRQCGAEDIRHRPACGRGKVHSFSVVHRAPGPAFKDNVPYAVLLVDLEEGPRMISTFTGGPPEDVTFDLNVTLVVEISGDGTALPRFRRS